MDRMLQGVVRHRKWWAAFSCQVASLCSQISSPAFVFFKFFFISTISLPLTAAEMDWVKFRWFLLGFASAVHRMFEKMLSKGGQEETDVREAGWFEINHGSFDIYIYIHTCIYIYLRDDHCKPNSHVWWGTYPSFDCLQNVGVTTFA